MSLFLLIGFVCHSAVSQSRPSKPISPPLRPKETLLSLDSHNWPKDSLEDQESSVEIVLPFET